VLTWLTRGAGQGDATAQVRLALWYLEGKYGKRDEELAMQWFVRAAQGGNAFAQARLGDVLVSGEGVKANTAAAVTWYERAAVQGHAGATAALTTLLLAKGSNHDDLPRLFELWLRRAKQGDALAQRIVGELYLRGIGAERSLNEAKRWLQVSSDQGNAAAMVLLGGLILQDPLESPKYPIAVSLLRRAVAQDSVDAEYNLGVCFRRGLGVNVDSKAAEQHYRLAAQREHVSAQLALGDLIAERAISDGSWAEAADWYRRAAKAGNPSAMVQLAGFLETGRGVTKDMSEAFELYRRAAAAGNEVARSAIQRLEAQQHAMR
jgi:TPR repeat protein